MSPVAFSASVEDWTEDFESFNEGKNFGADNSIGDHLKQVIGDSTIQNYDGNKFLATKRTTEGKWPRLEVNNFTSINQNNFQKATIEFKVHGNMAGDAISQTSLILSKEGVSGTKTVCAAAVYKNKIDVPVQGNRIEGDQTTLPRTDTDQCKIKIEIDVTQSKFKVSAYDIAGQLIGETPYQDLNRDGTVYSLDEWSISTLQIEHIGGMNESLYVDDFSMSFVSAPRESWMENFESYSNGQIFQQDSTIGDHLKVVIGESTIQTIDKNQFLATKMVTTNKWPRLEVNNFTPINQNNCQTATLEFGIHGDMADDPIAIVGLVLNKTGEKSKTVVAAVINKSKIEIPKQGSRNQENPTIFERSDNNQCKIKIDIDAVQSKFKVTVHDIEGDLIGESDYQELNKDGTAYSLAEWSISTIQIESIGGMNESFFVDNISMVMYNEEAPDPKPVIQNAQLSGLEYPGNQLTIKYNYSCESGDKEDLSRRTIIWESYTEESGWKTIPNESGLTYSLTEANLGQKIRARIQTGSTNAEAPLSDEVTTNEIGPVSHAPTYLSVYEQPFDFTSLPTPIDDNLSVSIGEGSLLTEGEGQDANSYLGIKMTTESKWPAALLTNFHSKINPSILVFQTKVKLEAAAQVLIQLYQGGAKVASICGAAIRSNLVEVPDQGQHWGASKTKIADITGSEWNTIQIEVDEVNSKFRTTVFNSSNQQIGQSIWKEFNSAGTVYTDCTIEGFSTESIGSMQQSIFIDDMKLSYIPKPVVPSVSEVFISGNVQAGEVLTANYTYYDENDFSGQSKEGNTLFQWLKGSEKNGTFEEISGATQKTYQLTEADMNSFIKVRVTPVSQEEPTTGEPVESSALATAAAPTASNAVIEGQPAVDETLTCNYQYQDINEDPEGATKFQWLYADSADGQYTEISGATAKTYQLTDKDIGKYFKVEVTPVSSKEPFEGIPVETAVFTGPMYPEANYVTIEGVLAQDQLLEAAYQFSDPNGISKEENTTFQWYKCQTADGTYEKIENATDATYRVTADEKGWYLKVGVIPGKSKKPFVGKETFSDPAGPVGDTVGPQAPEARQVQIIGTPAAGSVLTGDYIYYDINEDAEEGSTFRWLISDSLEGTYTAIENATEKTFTVPAELLGKYIKFEVTPQSSVEPKTGTPVTSIGIQISAMNQIFVSPDGDDSNVGTLENPLKTILGARDKIRSIKASAGLPKGGIVVYFRGGDYRLTSQIQFTEEDSGTEDAPIMYRPYQDEEVTFNGGITLDSTQFKPIGNDIADRLPSQDAKENVLMYDLNTIENIDFGQIYVSGMATPNGDHIPQGPPAPELFMNDERMTLARYPNITAENQYVTIDKLIQNSDTPAGSGGFSPTTPQTYGAIFTYSDPRPEGWATMEDVWLHGLFNYDWADSTTPIKNFDPSKKEITTEYASYYGFKSGGRYYYFNVLDELDEPGEWYLDRTTGILYLYPTADILESEVALSQLSEDVISIDQAHYITIKGFKICNARGNGISISGDHNLIDGCEIKNIASNAVTITGNNNGIINSEIHSIGGEGVVISGGDRDTLTNAENYVTNNHIHDWAKLIKTYACAIKISGVGITASHNEIHDAPHMGIQLNGNNHLLEYNNISYVCQETGDTGVIYSGRDWGEFGNVIRYNYLHDVQNPYPKPFGPFGIYIDDMASGFHVYGNIIANVGDRSMHFGGGMFNTIENNIVVQAISPIYFDVRGLWGTTQWNNMVNNCLNNLKALPIDQEPWLSTYPEATELVAGIEDGSIQKGAPYKSVLRNNISYQAQKATTIVTDKKSNHIWPTIEDNNPRYTTDPGFVDYENGNLDLRDDSKVFTDLPEFKKLPPIATMGRYSVMNQAPEVIDLAINGTKAIGGQIIGSYVFYDADGDLEQNTTYQWLISDTLNGPYQPILSATSQSLVITEEMGGKYIKIQVTPKDDAGSIGTTKESTPISIISDKGALLALIQEAQQEIKNATVGTELGNYPQSAVSTLESAIEKANGIYEDENSSMDLIASTAEELINAMETFKSTQITSAELSITQGTVSIPEGLQEISLSFPDLTGEIILDVPEGKLPATTIHASIHGTDISIQMEDDFIVNGNSLSLIKPLDQPTGSVIGNVQLAFTVGQPGTTYTKPIRIQIAGASNKSILTVTDGKATAITKQLEQDQASALGDDLHGKLTKDNDMVVWSKTASEYAVATLEEATNNALLSMITINGKELQTFAPEKVQYIYTCSADVTTVPVVAATAEDSYASVTITQATIIPGTATIQVTASDGITKKEYTIYFQKATSTETDTNTDTNTGNNVNIPSSGPSQGGFISIGGPGNSSQDSQNESSTSKFVDIQNHWAKNDIEALASKGIISGVTATTFEPDRQITRAEFSTLIVKALSLTNSASAGFTDVAAGAWYEPYVNAVANAGIMVGYDNQFRPDDLITREEMAVTVIKMYERNGNEATEDLLDQFDDKSAISNWALPYVGKAVSLGFMSGMSANNFAPADHATRAQAASMLRRFYDKIM